MQTGRAHHRVASRQLAWAIGFGPALFLLLAFASLDGAPTTDERYDTGVSVVSHKN